MKRAGCLFVGLMLSAAGPPALAEPGEAECCFNEPGTS